MPFLDEAARAELKERFDEGLLSAVQIDLYTRSPENAAKGPSPCHSCAEVEQLLEELTTLSPMLSYRAIDVDLDPAAASAIGVEHTPTITIGGDRAPIRFLGFPAGYEFVSFIETLMSVTQPGSGLAPASLEMIEQIQEPVKLEVFSTPT